jgi:hypothetical protein
MKHIKFTATPIGPKFDQVEVQIIAQSHVRYGFGEDGSCVFQAKDGLTLYSACSPDVINKGEICVWGSDPTRNGNKLLFTVPEYNKFRAAVEEYNEFFKEKPKVKKARQVLRVHAEAVGPDFKNVSVEVVEQSHFEGEFGNRVAEDVGDFVHGKVRLCSSRGVPVSLASFIPQRHKNKGLIGTFYVANNETKKDKLKTTVTVEVWQEILAAVEAYNKEFCSGVEEEVEVEEVGEWGSKKPEVPKKRWFIRTVDFVHSNYGTKKGTVAEFISLGCGWVNVRLSNGKSESWTDKNCKEITEAELAERFVEETPEIQKDRYFVRTKTNVSNPTSKTEAGLVGKFIRDTRSGRSVMVTHPNGQQSSWLKENCVEITEIPVVEKKRWFVRTKPNAYYASSISGVGTIGELIRVSDGGVYVKVPRCSSEFWDIENCVEIKDLPFCL